MSDIKVEVGVHLEFSLDHLDALEIGLMDIAITQAADKEDANHRAIGRYMKHAVPAYVAFMKAEMERGEDGGPAAAITALSRVSALLTSMTACIGASDQDKLKDAHKVVGQIIINDLEHLMKNAIIS